MIYIYHKISSSFFFFKVMLKFFNQNGHINEYKVKTILRNPMTLEETSCSGKLPAHLRDEKKRRLVIN